MVHQEELRLVDRALEHLHDKKLPLTDTDSRVSADRYYSPDWYQAEHDCIFSNVPSMLVHSSELVGPGAFVTMEHSEGCCRSPT